MLQEFDIDTERLPLGTLSKDQVQRGYDVLERLRSALNGSGDSLERLSSEFYQVACCHLANLHTTYLLHPQCCRQAQLQVACTCRQAATFRMLFWQKNTHTSPLMPPALHACLSQKVAFLAVTALICWPALSAKASVKTNLYA